MVEKVIKEVYKSASGRMFETIIQAVDDERKFKFMTLFNKGMDVRDLSSMDAEDATHILFFNWTEFVKIYQEYAEPLPTDNQAP